ncbi:hypothetical protein CMI37_11675 [Candidatus Pacearchaeota archaeon]|nr:hypothetical protein [Candidatus Pacearchaeota archaeon]
MAITQQILPAGITSELMEKLKKEKISAQEFVERRHEDWNENYDLYRNEVKTNRLTQRQSVNIPLMKETVKTLLSKIDDPPSVDWRELSGDKDKELLFQEVWNHDFERLNMEGIDIQDKKTVMLYGRGFKKMNWVDNQVEVTALDVYDVVVDPLTDPLDIETARFVIHQNIFRNLRDILADERYTKEGKDRLKIWVTSPEGLVQTAQNRDEWEKKMDRLKSMGVEHDEFPLFAGGDVMVNLTEHYHNLWNTKTKEFERRVVVYADDEVELLDEKLTDLLGVDFYPFVTWGEDVETQDFWSDGPADLVRVPNKIINIWYSQLVENRTLRNFQMHWYDATIQGYEPITYEPGAGRMLPAPGEPGKVIKPVEISGLDDTLNSIDFVIKMIERGTSATAIEKGVSERKQITLGEVQTLVGKAAERTLSLAKFYRRSWQEFAQKYVSLLEANARGKQTLFKASSTGAMWPKVVYATDWKSKSGYRAIVQSSSEQEEEKTKGIQRFMFLLQQFPNNSALKRIAQKRMLEIVNLTPEEQREVKESEEKRIDQLAQGEGELDQLAGQVPQQVGQAEQNDQQLFQSIQEGLQELNAE